MPSTNSDPVTVCQLMSFFVSWTVLLYFRRVGEIMALLRMDLHPTGYTVSFLPRRLIKISWHNRCRPARSNWQGFLIQLNSYLYIQIRVLYAVFISLDWDRRHSSLAWASWKNRSMWAHRSLTCDRQEDVVSCSICDSVMFCALNLTLLLSPESTHQG